MSSDRPPSYSKRNDHYRRQDRSRHHSRHDVSEGWSNTQHFHHPQQSGPNSWQAGSHRRWNNNENSYPKQQYPKRDQTTQWEEQQWDSSSRAWLENGSWDTRATSQPYYQDQDVKNRHDVDEWGREVRRGRGQSPTPDDQLGRNVLNQSHPKYHNGHHTEHRQQLNHDRSSNDQRKRRHSPQRDQRWERQSFNGQNKRRRTGEHELFQAQEYQGNRTRFRPQHPELQSDWSEPQYSHDHGPPQNPYSHETASQYDSDWNYSHDDVHENHWPAPLPQRLPDSAYSTNWPPAPPPPSAWHGPHPIPPTMPLPLPLHPPMPPQPPITQAPYPPARSDFIDYLPPYLPELELNPTKRTPTPHIPRHFSAEPNFTRPLEKGHPTDTTPARGPARGPGPRQQNKVRFSNHHIKKGRSALVRRFFEADDEEEPGGDGVPNSVSGPPPVIHRDPEGSLQRVDSIPDILLTTPGLPVEPITLPTQPAVLPSPESHTPPSRPATPKETQGDTTLAPLSPVPEPSRDLKPSVVEVTVPTPPITDSPEHDGLALVVTPIPVSQTGQRPLKATELFEFLGLVGQGAYGKVFKARERATGVLVALKKIKSEHAQDGFPVTGLREVKLLQSLKHDNVVTLREMVSRKGDIFLKFEYVPHDLVGLLKQQHITLEHAHIKSLMYQLLKGLAYIHVKGILHRDLKAANLLVTANGTLKLADFGLARFYYKRNTKADYTNRVCTIWYRPPELMLGLTVYGPEVDIWSAGCIFMEMFLKEAPFRGEDEIRQLHRVCASLGSPKADYCSELLAAPWYSLMRPAEEYDNVFALEWSEILPLGVIALAEKLLHMDRHARPSAAEAMQDPYFSSEPLPSPLDLTSLSVDCHEYDYAKKDKRKDDRPRLRSRRAPTAPTAAK